MAKGQKGRPAFVPSDEQREAVAAAFKSGQPVKDIARSIGVAWGTFRRVFAAETRLPGGDLLDTVATAPPKPPGRPRFQPTPFLRDRVRDLAALGTRHDLIALRLGISEPTLTRHFRVELDTGRDLLRIQMDEKLLSLARSGNIKAIEVIQRRIAEADFEHSTAAPPATTTHASPDAAAKPATPALGKKAARLADATSESNTGAWSDDLPTYPQQPSTTH